MVALHRVRDTIKNQRCATYVDGTPPQKCSGTAWQSGRGGGACGGGRGFCAGQPGEAAEAPARRLARAWPHTRAREYFERFQALTPVCLPAARRLINHG